MKSNTLPPSRIRRTVLVIGIVCLLASFAGVILVGAHKDESSNFAPPDKTRLAENFARLPLSFEINKGQIDQRVKFLSHGPGYDLFLTSNEAVLKVQKASEGTVLRLKLLGANATPQVEGQQVLPGKVSYFNGNDPAKWQRNIPTYRRVQFKEVYPGIDVVYYGNQRELEYDLVVAAGANPKLIRFSVEGAEQIRLDQTGKLLLGLKQGEVSLNKPVIYQLDENGSRREVKGTYVVNGNEVRFKLARFDRSKPLVIDPILTYSTLLGSGVNDTVAAIAVDSQGNAYVTGSTDSQSFPTTAGAFKSTSALGGAFVSKLDPTGSTLIYSTYLTGEGRSNGLGIAVDPSGNAYITGTTTAENFPIVNGLKTASNFFKTTDAAATWNNLNTGILGFVYVIALAPSAPNTTYAGTTEGFFRSTDGGATWIKAPTTTGFQSFLFANDLVVDPTNSSVVYLGDSSGPFKSTDGGNNWSRIGPTVNFSTVFSIQFDPSAPTTIYVGARNGVFKSTDSGSNWVTLNNGLPSTPTVQALAIDPTAPLTIYAGTSFNGLFKTTDGGGSWTPMNSGMGGGNPTLVSAIAIDPANPATIYTGHGDTPGAGGINKSTNGGASWTLLTNGVPNAGIFTIVATPSALYAAVNSNGVIKSTNGGSSWTSVATGLWTTSVNTLVPHPTDQTVLYAGTTGVGLADAFVTKLNSTGSGVLFSTFVGGSNEDIGSSIAVDGSGNIVIAGQTRSTNFPVVNAVRPSVTFDGNCATGFVTKLNPAVPSYTFSTYLGGGRCDLANSVATDSSGNVYVTGRTASVDFPTANAIQPAIAGSTQFPKLDAFVSKLTPAGSLIYSTYLGGTDDDSAFGIAADASGNAYITGVTSSTNFPTMNPIQASLSGSLSDVFVTKLNSTGSALVYSTYLGGSLSEGGRSIAVDSANNAYVTGTTTSFDFPLVAGALRTKSPIYKSLDSAANWSNENYGFTAATITSMVINPTQPSTLYAGTQSGVFKSINTGRTWSAINNGLTNLNVAALVIDPSAPSTLYIAISGIQSGAGVYKSTDGGSTWNLRNNGVNGTNLLSLAIDPVTPNTLYLGVSAGNVNLPHIYKTTNGADNWVPLGGGPPAVPASLAIDPQNHATIYAADSLSPGAFYKSIDAGLTWQPLPLNQPLTPGRSIAVSPLTSGLVLASSDDKVFRSVDGGNNWSTVLSISGKIVFDPVNSSIVYLASPKPFAAAQRGVFKSTDSGQTWVAMNKGLNAPVASVLVIDPLRPSTLHMASVPSDGIEAFVTKINSAGNALVYSTIIGGPLKDPTISFTSAQASGIALDSAGNAYVAGSSSTLAFPVTPNAYQPFNRGGDDAFIVKLGTSYSISGRVLQNGAPGAPLSGAEVVLNDGTSLTSVLTESDGSYLFPRLREGGNYTVSAASPHFVMTPASQTFNNLSSDQVLDFNAITSDSPFHTISGQITENGTPLPGVTVTLSGSQSGLRTTDSNGNYSYELIIAGNYTVTPSLLGFNFAPASQTFNSLNTNQTANFTATRQNFVVTNTNDHGSGSLREAIINANATLGKDTIVFNIPGPGVKTIIPLIALPEITDSIVIDGTTQTGYAGTPLIEIDGTMLGFANSHGLLIKAGGSTVRGLAIGNFRNANGIVLQDCDNNLIQGNYLGVAPDGTTAHANVRGLALNNSDNNMIGGTTAAARNILSGNGGGIEINGNANTIQGNFIGTNAVGTAIVRNVGGVDIFGPDSTDNLIGGTAPGAGNLISGNEFGIENHGNGTTIQGNLVGTDITGTNRVPNANGIQSVGLNTLIGGLTPGARNVVSGNTGNGVYLRGAGNKLQGNYIGTDISGTLALGNFGDGVIAGDTALIGGTVPEARNIISANGGIGDNGNVALGFNNSGSAAIVRGNYIGTDVTGTRALGGSLAGINIVSNNNVIGGTVAGARNVISGNQVGIQLGTSFSGSPSGSIIQGNIIGLNAQGTGPLPNIQQGIAIAGGMNSVIEAANQIAFNGGPGIAVSAGTGNSIRGNSIFSNNGLGIDLGTTAGVTPNDGNDPDTGPNNLQNFPVITSVISSANSMTIQGSLKSLPNTAFQIDFYSNAAVDPSGNGEGAQFIGASSVNTNGNGDATINATFPVGLASGRVITATATDPNGNTSEFSAADPALAFGSVQFSVSSIVVIEDLGTLNVTVLRTGGSVGSMSVDYATVDGTAIAGQDYTATSGTLTFNAGETSKTIQIPIADDATTEPDENFTVVLRNASSLEALGGPSTLLVTLLDHSTIPFVFINDVAVTEGNTGTTDAVFTITLTALTGRAVSGTYATSNLSAFGGAKCSDQGSDYEAKSGNTFSFPPGTTQFTVPVKICGDTNAEANETFRVNLTSLTGAQFFDSVGVGTIVNDDVLELMLEESGPSPDQAAALDSYFATRDPFRVFGLPEWFVGAPDQNTRVTFFARGLQLNPGELPSAVIVRIVASNSQVFDVSAEDVRSNPGTDLTQLVIRLPNNLVAGTCSVSLRAHTRVSNTGAIRIVP